ncbi:MAG: hypothetical protein KGM97_09525 [Alphaproteobacteria bacterium]|nr:hypothetical protein [Alphaproteobacteria bacterium]MDE2631215.1 hypothetical protein [Alphaproteobacteria bacterium]
MIDSPMMRDLPLDVCRIFENECGKPASDARDRFGSDMQRAVLRPYRFPDLRRRGKPVTSVDFL